MLLGKLVMPGRETAAIRQGVCLVAIAISLFTPGRLELHGQDRVDYRTQVEPLFKERSGCHLGTDESGVEHTSDSTLMGSIGQQ